MTSTNHWLLTHSYDKNISKDIYTKIKSLIPTFDNISKDGKLLVFAKLRSELNTEISIKFYDQMINDYINNNMQNYDPLNELDPIDLLYIIYLISQNNNEILLVLNEQLKDMQSGSCPQGRSIRLLQTIYPFL